MSIHRTSSNPSSELEYPPKQRKTYNAVAQDGQLSSPAVTDVMLA